MEILYYDPFAGISGDMNLGAMIDIGVDKDYLIKELSKLDISNEFELIIKRDNRKGIEGVKVDVSLIEKHHEHHDVNSTEVKDTHINHKHHEHRNLQDIKTIIDNSSLNDNVKKISLKMFFKIAEAEAKVHGSTIEDIHFHEVGGIDSIVDMIGAAICFDYLNVDKVLCSSIELGGGFVKCAHGIFPVPAPATIEILKGIPVKTGAVPFETTTPTGATILATLVDEFTKINNFKINKIGYGIGNRDTEIPNVLRVMLCTI